MMHQQLNFCEESKVNFPWSTVADLASALIDRSGGGRDEWVISECGDWKDSNSRPKYRICRSHSRTEVQRETATGHDAISVLHRVAICGQPEVTGGVTPGQNAKPVKFLCDKFRRWERAQEASEYDKNYPAKIGFGAAAEANNDDSIKRKGEHVVFDSQTRTPTNYETRRNATCS